MDGCSVDPVRQLQRDDVVGPDPLGFLMVRMTAEIAQHAGQADIVRELIDGRGGPGHDTFDDASWRDYVARVEAAAVTFRPPG